MAIAGNKVKSAGDAADNKNAGRSPASRGGGRAAALGSGAVRSGRLERSTSV